MGPLRRSCIGPVASMTASRILLDCRWLFHAGPGRATELLLRGLAASASQTPWALWGPPSIRQFAWPGASVEESSSRPSRLRGQRDWFRIPPSELVVFMHQQRPLRKVRSVTFIYDTIPLRYASSSFDRKLKLLFLKRVGAISVGIITISDYSRRCIAEDLGLPEQRVSVLRFPFDEEFANRILKLRRQYSASNVALFVGRFLPHKNLSRLINAFGRTEFQASGGKLLLVGGSPQEIAELQAPLTNREKDFVDIRGRCSQEELDRLFASSLFLVQPSLEEGFGLPAHEALSCGLPLCASDGGALREVTHGLVEHFSANSAEEMAAAVDACATRAGAANPEDDQNLSDEFRRRAPSVREFTEQFLESVERALRS